jgi:spore coat protein U-like protein
MQLRTFIAAVAAVLAAAGPARAQVCSFSNTDIDFGNISTATGGFQTSSGTFSANCIGLPRQTIRICPNFNAGSGGIDPSGAPRLLTRGSSGLRYDLFRGNGVGQGWGSYTWQYSTRPPTITLTLDALGFGSVSQTVYARLYNQQSVATTGTFWSVFGGSQTQIDYGYATSFQCSSSLSARARSAPFTVRATNNSSCTVSASDLNFGVQSSLASGVTTTNSITALCTAGTEYEIGLGNGSSGATSPADRRMKAAGGSGAVQYQIFRDGARSQVWGNTIGNNTVSAVGTGASQTFTGYGLVPPQQTPPANTYSDTIVVTVTY